MLNLGPLKLMLGTPHAAAAPGGLTPFLGAVANNCGMNRFVSGNDWSMAITPHVMADDVTAIKFVYGNFQIGSPGEFGPGATATIRVAAQYLGSVTGEVTWPTFSGTSNVGLIANGGILTSDWLNITVPKGGILYSRAQMVSPGHAWLSAFQDTTNGGHMEIGSGTPSNKVTSGTIGDTVGGYSHRPLAILAMTTKRSIILVGDSIQFGYGGASGGQDERCGIYAPGLPANMPFINVGSSGLQARDFFTSMPSSAALMAYYSNVGSDFGINDVEISSASAAALQGYVEAIFAAAPAYAGKFQSQLTPNNSATSGTPPTAVGLAAKGEPNYGTYNAVVAALGLAGQTGQFSTRDLLTATTNIWNQAYTNDLLHPNQAGYDHFHAAGRVAALPFVGAT